MTETRSFVIIVSWSTYFVANLTEDGDDEVYRISHQKASSLA